MAGSIQIRCPKCRQKYSARRRSCLKCGINLQRLPIKDWWVVYIDPAGKKRRKGIGKSTTKTAAEQYLRDINTAMTEGRYIQRDQNQVKTLSVVLSWYKELSEVNALRKYKDRIQLLDKLVARLGENLKVSQLSLKKADRYRGERLAEINPKSGLPYRPATVNRELDYLKAMLNKAVKYGELDRNPISGLSKLAENNVRERVLSSDEFKRLLMACTPHIKPVVLMAFHMGMRKSEILRLTWNEVDLESGFIRLGGLRTKNKEGRVIPLHPDVKSALEGLPSRKVNPWNGRVFLDHRNRPFNDCRDGYNSAVEKAGFGDFTFHDLRHCAVNNLRLANNDRLTIRKMTGHKTNSTFERYTLVTEEEVKQIKWLDKEKDKLQKEEARKNRKKPKDSVS